MFKYSATCALSLISNLAITGPPGYP